LPPAEKKKRIAAVYTDDKGTLKREEIDLFRRGREISRPGRRAVQHCSRYGDLLPDAKQRTLDGHRFLSSAAFELMTAVHTGDLQAGSSP